MKLRRLENSPILEVIALGPHDWRVCDSRIDPVNARRIIAYVEIVDARYEVVWMSPAVSFARFDSYESLVSSLESAAENPAPDRFAFPADPGKAAKGVKAAKADRAIKVTKKSQRAASRSVGQAVSGQVASGLAGG